MESAAKVTLDINNWIRHGTTPSTTYTRTKMSRRIKSKELSSNTLMGFGKYQDKTLEWVMAHDRQYMEWCMSENILK